MARKIDPTVESILRGFDLEAKEVLWDCHGTWCMYHRAIEKVAAKVGIAFEPPSVMQSDATTKSVAICVSGYTKEGRKEWSIGEAAPGNNKNAYPWAMAEKRAKDRVVLKLIGLHGLIYSEEEMDNGSGSKQAEIAAQDSRTIVTDMKNEINATGTFWKLQKWGEDAKRSGRIEGLLPPEQEEVRQHYAEVHRIFKEQAKREENILNGG